MASHNMPKVIKRVQEQAERLIEQPGSANALLNQVINQYAMPLIRFKQMGVAPDMASLEDLCGKLLAIIAATYDSQDAVAGKLP